MLRLYVSGSVKTEVASDKNRMQIDNVKIDIPYCDEKYFKTFAERMLPIYIKKDNRYKKKNYEGRIKIYIDKVEEFDGKPLCIGKNIKEMNWEELQSLACYLQPKARDMMSIPLFRGGDLRAAREKAYELYVRHIQGRRVFKSEVDITQFKDRMFQQGMRMQMTDSEIKADINKKMENSLSMVVNPKDPKNSYKFRDLPPIVIEDPEPNKGYGKTKKESEKKEEAKA